MLTCDTNDTGFKAFGGFRLNDNLALEVGGAVLGEASLNGTVSGVRITLEFDGTVTHNHSFSLAPVIHVPLGNFSVFGKFGIHRWDVDIESEGEFNSEAFNVSESDSGVDPFYGAGGQLQMTENMDIRIEWERYQFSDLNGQSDADSEVDAYFASLIYRF